MRLLCRLSYRTLSHPDNPLRGTQMPLRSTCTGEPPSGAVPGILWLAGVRT